MLEINHWNSYGVFCMAMLLKNSRTTDLDVLYTTAVHKYEKFIESDFNNLNEPEIECIAEFLKFYNL